MSKTVVLTYPDETPDERIKADLSGVMNGFGPRALSPAFGISAVASPGLAAFAQQYGGTVTAPPSGGGANVGTTIIGYSGPGYAGFCNIVLEVSPAPETYPYIGRVEPPYATAFVGNNANVPCFDMSENPLGTGQAIVADGLLTGVGGLDIAPPESHDVELDQGDAWTARWWNQADESAVAVTVAEDDGVFFARFPEDATAIKHGDQVLQDPDLTANVQSGQLISIVGAVIIGKDGTTVYIENTAGGTSIQGTVVAATIGGGGGGGIQINTPYNVIQNGQSLPFTKLDGTTLLGGSANCGTGAGGNAVARLVGANFVLEDQQAVVVGGSTYTFTIADNVITDIDVT